MQARFTPGQVIARREMLDGREWLLYPVRVVADEGDLLVVYLAEGTPLTFGTGDFRWGPHPWSEIDPFWQSDGVLQIQRSAAAYAVWPRWKGSAFEGWYVNFQHPMRRTAHGFDTLDLELDLWIPGDGSPYRWKDVAEFHELERSGGLSVSEAAQVRQAAAEVTDLLAQGTPWWEKWRDWRPPRDWTVPGPIEPSTVC
ncbi:DUF402 domain-containing protein [Streptomyces sp. YIM B13518]|uniref:DUF402 domain-containing protein n=1 Tax=Streptomyces sp. YIM B13518 TaxID=3366316 RepID=UPI003674751C